MPGFKIPHSIVYLKSLHLFVGNSVGHWNLNFLRHFGFINNEKERKQLVNLIQNIGASINSAHFYISWLTSLLLQKYMENENTSLCLFVCVCRGYCLPFNSILEFYFIKLNFNLSRTLWFVLF